MIKECEKPELTSKKNICPDYDNECIDVEDYKRCYLGYMPCGTYFGIAEGHCPMLKLL